MVKLTKSPLPDGITITCADDYRNNPIFSIIKDDCYGKCYICEEKEPTKINVEHRVAYKGNLALKYDWNNLFFSCAHCNSAKLASYNNTINCIEVDPEDYIGLAMCPYPMESVIVSRLQATDSTEETAQLLELIYNGSKTAMLTAECDNLRNRIFKELLSFQSKLISYFDEPASDYKEELKMSIRRMVLRSASFAAFKRKIIRDNPRYRSEFGEYI